MKYLIPLLLICFNINSQNLNVNDEFNYNLIRNSLLKGDSTFDFSLNIRPVSYTQQINKEHKTIFSKKKLKIKSLGIDYFIEYNTHHPYNRNNGTMVPNRGYQHIISPGIYFELGPLSIQLKPEQHFSENLDFDGFWEGHYPVIWSKRYKLWNQIDMPERHGENQHNKITLGQSSIKLNWKNLSIGVSNENLWWGPSIRNSIMMSNHASGFKHITFKTNKPIKSKIGNFEWQFITGRLESSGFKPSGNERTYAGSKIYIPKINQLSETDDWRFLQGFIVSFSPNIIDGLSLGLIKWTQMYSALIRGKYSWIEGNINYFPVFSYIFRSNNKSVDYEIQTNEAMGLFLKWNWADSNAEFYVEFHHNDSKINLRDLILDSDHSRAVTFGLQKIFKVNRSDLLFSWEWTQMEQTAGRLIRNAGSWYEHYYVYDGYTNKGEVLGSSIGPGSNSHYFSISKLGNKSIAGLAFEIIDNDNDFYYEAFSNAKDFRRYWKDFNVHINFSKKFKKYNISSRLIYIRSLNYQWELDDYATPYYHPGRDVDNFHLSLKFTYFGNW